MNSLLQTEALERLLSRFTISDTRCFEYTRGLDDKGYGQLYCCGKKWKTHRLAWHLMEGPIPEGLHVLHKCDNRKCLNTEHLYLGNQQDNMRDAAKRDRMNPRNRSKTHCIHGHEFTFENTYIDCSNNKRQCRACHRQRDHSRRKKAAA